MVSAHAVLPGWIVKPNTGSSVSSLLCCANFATVKGLLQVTAEGFTLGLYVCICVSASSMAWRAAQTLCNRAVWADL